MVAAAADGQVKTWRDDVMCTVANVTRHWCDDEVNLMKSSYDKSFGGLTGDTATEYWRDFWVVALVLSMAHFL